VIVTNNFHMFRALGIARKQGYANVEGLAAGSVLGMGPNNLLREFLGVVKDFLVGNL
ncbi:MAG: YdcF family protein, partial [Lachnospiraceae bacterium]|nr:YdcF family protein [Lachnospiraceae bacterium]